jgi:L-2-hydroxyglutarate oxidase LhgO
MAISVWEQSTYFAPKDLVIVGCGFVGLWTAYEAIHQNPKLNITILERGTIPSGASTRNAGFSCFGSVSELISDIQLMGEAAMLETVKMRYDGLQRIQGVVMNYLKEKKLVRIKKQVKQIKGSAVMKVVCMIFRN